MPSLHYFAAWTDSGCLMGCDHEHATVVSAVACLSVPGGFVMAVEHRETRALTERTLTERALTERALTEEEEREFQEAAGHTRPERSVLGIHLPFLKPNWKLRAG